jgi:uncharacterized iron-regulated membrane protein
VAKDIRQKNVKRLRKYRVYHKIIGLALAILLLVSAVTGLFLGWKKNVDLLQPATQKGVSAAMQDWKSIEELSELSIAGLYAAYPEQVGNGIDRLDVRPSKGIAKVLFEKGWWEVQIDCTSGAILSVAKRHSDWIEKLHDGSIISDTFKLISMNVLGLGLSLMILTGVWLWYGPKLIKRLREKS